MFYELIIWYIDNVLKFVYAQVSNKAHKPLVNVGWGISPTPPMFWVFLIVKKMNRLNRSNLFFREKKRKENRKLRNGKIFKREKPIGPK